MPRPDDYRPDELTIKSVVRDLKPISSKLIVLRNRADNDVITALAADDLLRAIDNFNERVKEGLKQND